MCRNSTRRLSRKLFLGLASVAVATAAGVALANPPGIPQGSRLVYNFNVLGYPAGQTYDGNCGSGHRIFVNREASNAKVLVQNSTEDWHVVDCNATGDHQAILTTYAAGTFDVYARILGKPTGRIRICADTLLDVLSGETLCLLGTLDLTRDKGQPKFSLQPSSMFDASLGDVLWQIETNSNFRIVQFRVYERP